MIYLVLQLEEAIMEVAGLSESRVGPLVEEMAMEVANLPESQVGLLVSRVGVRQGGEDHPTGVVAAMGPEYLMNQGLNG